MDYQLLFLGMFIMGVLAAFIATIVTWLLNRNFPPQHNWNEKLYLVLEDGTKIAPQVDIRKDYNGWLPSHHGWLLPRHVAVKGFFFPDTNTIPAIWLEKRHVEWMGDRTGDNKKTLPILAFQMRYSYFDEPIGKGVIIFFDELLRASNELLCVDVEVHTTHDKECCFGLVIAFRPVEVTQSQPGNKKIEVAVL